MGKYNMIQFFKQLSGKLGSNIYAGIQEPSNPQNLAFLRRLQKEMRENSSLDAPLSDLNVVVFDIETTGFYPERGDRIISIGAVKMTGQQVHRDKTFYSLVKSELPLSDEITTLTDIRQEQLLDAPSANEVLLQFFKFVQTDILIAHHSKHERSFMEKITTNVLNTRFDHRIIDTSFLIRLENPLLKPLSLEEACRECGIEIKDRHHALGDAIMTALIWEYYLAIAQNKGFTNLREIYEYLGKMG